MSLNYLKYRISGNITGGLSFNSTSLPPTITAGNYEMNSALVDFNADQTLALTDTLLQSRQALESFAQYLVCLDNTGVKKYILYGEGAIASATGNITSITGSGTTKTITASTGTFPANSFTRGGILVISGNNGVNGVFKVASYTSGTVVTFESVATVTGTGSGTWTLYDRINTLHGVGSATAIIVDADVVKYTPSLGENGWSAGIASWNTTLNGYYLTIAGLTGYRVLGSFNTGASSVVSRNVFSYKTGRNKNDNDWYIRNPTSQTGVTGAIRGCTIARMTGCDYIYVDNGTVGTEFTLQRNCHANASYSAYTNSGHVAASILASFTTTNTWSGTSTEQQTIIAYVLGGGFGLNLGISRLLNGAAIIKPLTQGVSTGDRPSFSGSLTL